MCKLTYLQLLLVFMLCQLKIERILGLNWLENSSNIKLLGLFPQQSDKESVNDMWTVHCRSMFRAAIVLSQRYNITFQGQFLSYEEILTGDDIMVTIDYTCRKVSTSNIVGIVGPAYSSEARFLASFAHRLGIPSVSYSATSSDLSTIDNGAFYRVVPSDENLAIGITVLFEQYKWKSCIIIYQNDEYGYNGMKLLNQKFSEKNIKTRNIIKFDMNEGKFQINFKKTLLNSLSRIVIVWANEEITETILNQALEEDLVGSDFVWILTTAVPLDRFNQKQQQDLIGIITIEPAEGNFVDESINTTLLNQAYEIWKHYESDTFPGDNNISSFALYTFDATWSLILSLQELCSMQSSCLELLNISNCYERQFLNSKLYYNIMKTTSFLGVSGDVKFSNGTPDRVGHAYYIIKNIRHVNAKLYNIDYVPLLKWDITNSTKWIDYKNESNPIIWPNLSKDLPVDHKLIRGEELSMVIIEAPPFIKLKNPTTAYSGMTGNYKRIDATEFDGIYKDIMSYLQLKMGFIPVIWLSKKGTQYNELVDGVVNGLFDTVMSTIIITANRTRIVDFSRSLISSSARVVIRKSKSDDLDFIFLLRPFSWQLWLVLIATLFCFGILIWYFETYNRSRRPANSVNDVTVDHRVNSNGPVHSIMDTLCIMLGRGPFYVATSNSGRILVCGLYIEALILLAVYTAKTFSFMTQQDFAPIVTGLDDIKNGKIPPNRLGLVVGSAIAEFYLGNVSQGKNDYYPLKTSGEIYTRLRDHDIDAAIWTNLSVAYHTTHEYCDLMTAGIDFWYSTYQLPLKQEWLYKAELDSSISSLIDSQELERILAKYSGQPNCGETNLLDTKTQSIALKPMVGLFAILIIITVISFLVHFL